ncbi:hypothetical protein ACFPJ1_19520 [Kribbella qitaiheensis]|uniref:hypothetical protein n=1 Tax=Kribbella qitaiheensis TaxID=1544730 RepID=UPI0036173A19
MNELLPILGGLLLGVVLQRAHSLRTRLLFGGISAIIVGAVATIVSGEYLISWGFLLVDIPLVAVSAAAAYFGTRTLSVRIRTWRGRPGQ